MNPIFRLAVLMCLAWGLAACSRPEALPEAVRAVRTMTVASQPSAATQEFAAEIRARTESRLGFRVAGKMISRAAEVGQHVRPADVLAQLDPQDLQLALQAARAAVDAAQVNLDLSVAEYRRFKDLRDQGFISAAELERREAALKAARAQLEQARAQADAQRNQAAYSKLVANAPGIVVAIDAEPGAVLAAGSPVLRLAVDGARDAVFAVPEDGVAGMRALLGRNGAVGVKLWASSETLRGTVREVAAAADPSTRTFLVKADLAVPDLPLGRTATVSVALPPQGGATRLPLSAVAEHGGGSVSWVVDPASMTVRRRAIEVAGAQGNEVVVARGLSPGDVVVTAGVHVLSEGQKVKLMSSAAVAPLPSSAASR